MSTSENENNSHNQAPASTQTKIDGNMRSQAGFQGNSATSTPTSSLNDMDETTRKLVQETAKIPWHELQRFFAAGKAVYVDSELDLIQVAKLFASDNAEKIQELMQGGQVKLVDDETASKWYDNNTITWATVVSPWVLVQATDTTSS